MTGSASPLRPVPVPLRTRLQDLRRGVLPVVVWVLAMAGAGWLLVQRSEAAGIQGLVVAADHEVSAAVPGVVAEVLVDLHQEVAAGAPLAALDGRQVEARIATARAETARLRAELEAERARLAAAAARDGRDWSADRRRFVLDRTRWRLESLRVQVELEADRVEAERLALRVERVRQLVAAEAASQEDLDNARLAHRRILERIARNEDLLAGLRQELAAAEERLAAFEASPPSDAPALADAALAPLEAAVQVQELAVAALQAERQALTLRAPVAGVVLAVAARPGQAVLAGEPVVVLRPAASRQVVLWLPETEAGRLHPGDRVDLRLPGDSAPPLELTVRATGPGIEELPRRLWRSPGLPEYGQAVSLEPLPEDRSLLPGVRVLARVRG